MSYILQFLLLHFQLSLLVLKNCSQNFLELKILFMTEAYVLYDTFAFVNKIRKLCGCLFFFNQQHRLEAHLMGHLCLCFSHPYYFSFFHSVAAVVTQFAFPSYSPPLSSSSYLSKQKETELCSLFFLTQDKFMFLQHTAGGQLMLIFPLKYYFSQFLCLFFQTCQETSQ